MIRLLSLLFILFTGTCVCAQNPLTYTTENGQVHLAGPHTLADLQNTPFAKWYAEKAAATDLPETTPEWAANLNNTRVKIFLGTWCGDSKTWVPQFVTLWKALGLSENQLEFTALYDTENRYKQGPNGEEKGYRIHRVPTFIFESDGAEVARIVERPRTDLMSDLAHVAMGYPSTPRYQAANYLFEQFDAQPLDSIQANLQSHYLAIRHDFGNFGGLNTLGYVLLRAGRIEEALLTFRVNAAVFPHTPNTIDSYAEAWLVKGDEAKALELYERVLELTPEDERVADIVATLRAKIPDSGKK